MWLGVFCLCVLKQFGTKDCSNVSAVFRTALVPVPLWLWHEGGKVCVNCCRESQASLSGRRWSWAYAKSCARSEPRQILGTGNFAFLSFYYLLACSQASFESFPYDSSRYMERYNNHSNGGHLVVSTLTILTSTPGSPLHFAISPSPAAIQVLCWTINVSVNVIWFPWNT